LQRYPEIAVPLKTIVARLSSCPERQVVIVDNGCGASPPVLFTPNSRLCCGANDSGDATMTVTELNTLVQLLRERGRPENPTVPQMRERFKLLGQKFPAPADAVVEPVVVGEATGEWISAPGVDRSRVVLHLHGGGYVLGDGLVTHRNFAYNLSRAADARVLLLDYRLAPEFPFPAAVEDATAACRHILAEGIEPRRLVISGDSAGGGLAVSTMVVLRDDGDPLPAGAICISPWTDMEGTGETMQSKLTEDPMITPEAIAWFAELYLAGADPRSPLATPLNADLAGLPPLLIQVGSAECLLDDARRLAARAEQAGVDVRLEVADRMIHVWHLFAPMLSEGRDAIERAGSFVRERTGG